MKFFKFLFIASFFFIISCNNEVDQKPHDINFDRDICANCLMGLADQKYSVQAINKYGEILWFDDVGCLVKFDKSEDWKRFDGDNSKIWIGDCEHGGWIDMKKAYYRYGDTTPMGFGYGAMKEKKDGSFSYEQVHKMILGGKTEREKYLKEYKMMDK